VLHPSASLALEAMLAKDPERFGHEYVTGSTPVLTAPFERVEPLVPVALPPPEGRPTTTSACAPE
jgi:hypothetical protein